MKPDLVTAHNPSFCTIRAVTQRGLDWIDDNLDEEASPHTAVVAIDHRYIVDIIENAVDDGLIVQDQETGRRQPVFACRAF